MQAAPLPTLLRCWRRWRRLPACRSRRACGSRPTLTSCLPARPSLPLQDASKARESRLRKAGLQSRARMASKLREMDNDIAGVSKALAVSRWPAAGLGAGRWPAPARPLAGAEPVL